MTNSFSRKTALFILCAMMILSTFLSMRLMRVSSLWYDEVWSVKCAGGAQYGKGVPVLDALKCALSAEESNPPGYYIVLNLWGSVAGWGEFNLWMLSLLTGLVAVASIYRLGYDLFAKSGSNGATLIGFSAAVILILSAFFLQFLVELRVYGFVVLGTIWFVWLYWRLAQRPKPSIKGQISFMLLTAGLLYFHYLTICVIGAVALYHLIAFPKTRAWWRVPILMAVAAVLFLPWVNVVRNAASVLAHRSTLTAGQMLSQLAYSFSNSSTAFLALFLIFAAVAWSTRRTKPVVFAWLIFGFALSLGLIMVIFVPGVNHVRYLIFLWPLAAILVAVGIFELQQRRINPAYLLLIWVAAGLWSYIYPTRDNMRHDLRLPWREFHAELQVHSQTGDLVLFHTPVEVWFRGLELQHYLSGLPVRGLLTEDVAGKVDNGEYLNEARKTIGSAARVWLGVDQSSEPNFRLGEVKHILAENYVYCSTPINVPDMMRLELYSRKHPAPTLRFGDAPDQIEIAALEPITVTTDPVNADRNMSVLLAFSYPDTLPKNTYSVGLHIDDAQGQLKAQTDFGLPTDLESCSLARVSLKGLPAGQYTVRVVIYEWQTGKQLAGLALATGLRETRPALGTLEVK